MKPALIASCLTTILAVSPAHALSEQEDHFGKVTVKTTIGNPDDDPPLQNGALIAFSIDIPSDKVEWVSGGLNSFSFGCENRGSKFYFTLVRRTRGSITTVARPVTISTESISITGEAQVAAGMVGSLDFPELPALLQSLAQAPGDIRFDVSGEFYNFPTRGVSSGVYARFLKQCSSPVS